MDGQLGFFHVLVILNIAAMNISVQVSYRIVVFSGHTTCSGIAGSCVCKCYVNSVMFDSLRPYVLQPIRLLCPWDFPGKNTGVVYHALRQGTFSTEESNPCLLCLCAFMSSVFTTTPTWEALVGHMVDI